MQSSSSNPPILKRTADVLNISDAALKVVSARSSVDATSNQTSKDSLREVELKRVAAGVDRGGSVTKPAIYTAAIHAELAKRGEKHAKHFIGRFAINLALTKQSNGEPIKPAAHTALNDLIRAGVLSAAEAKQITHLAWLHAYKNDSERTDAAKTGRNPVNARATASPGGTTMNSGSTQRLAAPQGFLWKPVADSPPHGLAVLLPPAWSSQVASLELLDPASGEVIARGRDGGIGNGDRQHFRFNQQGSHFPDGTIVRVSYRNGEVKEVTVPESSARMEGR